MRYFSLLLIATALLVGCHAKKEAKDEKGVKAALEAYQDAFNYQNAEKMGALWSSDAVLTNSLTGEVTEGRDAIIALFKKKFEQKENRIQIVHKKVEFIDSDTAVERGLAKIDIANQPAKQVAFEMTFVKQDGKWLIDEVGEIELEPTPSNFEHLRELAWLEGDWEDVDPDTAIVFHTQWDKFKNFLVQNFTLKVLDEDILEGKQLIAWDPVQEKIRSWVFDSDGGFGEGSWKKSDKSWYVALTYTLGDGRTATATNVYTPVNATTYTFASIERDVDGEILPNMDPVNVQRITKEENVHAN